MGALEETKSITRARGASDDRVGATEGSIDPLACFKIVQAFANG